MEVRVDQDKCVGAGLCVMTDDSVFDQDEATGVVHLLTDAPPPERHHAVREASRICPAQAISVHEDTGQGPTSGPGYDQEGPSA